MSAPKRRCDNCNFMRVCSFHIPHWSFDSRQISMWLCRKCQIAVNSVPAPNFYPSDGPRYRYTGKGR